MNDGLHMAWARGLVLSLAACGVGRFVISPGSRSTPLALALAELEGERAGGQLPVDVTVVVDERAAGFFALGAARAAGQPVALMCTSGSAAAHYFPAIVEAQAVGAPLIAITADRPIELARAGASQTIDQLKLFGDQVRAFFDLGAPDSAALAQLPALAARVVGAALGPGGGPVHLNARFRKPLEPTPDPGAAPLPACAAPPRLFVGRLAPSPEAVDAALAFLLGGARPALVFGPARAGFGASVGTLDALATLARAGLPALGEATCGLPLGAALTAPLGAVLAGGAAQPALLPDRVLELGLHPVDAAYGGFAQRTARATVAPGPPEDPLGNAALALAAEAEPLLAALAARLGAIALDGAAAARRRAWTARLAAGTETLRAQARDGGDDAAPLDEPFVARALTRALDRGLLCVGQSLAVRDLDASGVFGLAPGARVLHQRGAAGIDGLLAGAIGARAATTPALPVGLLYGDVSALHDVGSFALLGAARGPLLVVVVDNDGGRIFDELPIARVPAARAAYERMFLTRPGAFVAGVARGFGLDHAGVTCRGELAAALARGLGSDRPLVIEARTDLAASRRARAAQRDAARVAFGEGGDP